MVRSSSVTDKIRGKKEGQVEEIVEYRQDLLSALEGVAGELSGVVERIPPDAWSSPSALYARTPHYVLASLQAHESQLFSAALHRIVEEESPLFPLFDVQVWMAEHYQPDTPVTEILAEFCSLRRQDVTWLRTLPAETWNRLGRHPWWGKRTLLWWVELQLEVSRQHLRELSASLPH